MSHKITIRRLGLSDADKLSAVSAGLFDNPVEPALARQFLADPGHVIFAAFDGDTMVSFASATVLQHPDKAPSLFVNEVGTRDAYLRRGLASGLLEALFAHARSHGIEGIWLATEGDNAAARGLYKSMDARETGGIVVYDWDGAMDTP